MKVTVKTVSDRITMLEAQQTLSLNEESTLNTYRWALEQHERAEAAEKAFAENEQDKQRLFVQRDTLISANLTVGKALKAAEAQLAELAKQKPVGYTTERAATYEVWNSGSACFWSDKDMGDFPLYSRPAPAAVPVLYRWWFKDKPDQINIIQPDLVDTLVRKDGLVIEGLAPVSREDGLDAKRRAFIDSLADNTSTQYDSLRKAEE